MKNIITVHIILCGLLSGTMMASEKNSAIITTVTIMSQSASSQSNSPQGSVPIPIIPKKRSNSSFSYSSSTSPKYREALGISLSPRSSISEKSISLSPGSIEDSTLVKNFYAESSTGSKEKYYLINRDGTPCDYIYITDEDKKKYLNYKAQLIIENNGSFIKTINLINSKKPLTPKEEQFSVKTNLNKEQIKELQKLSHNEKLVASDDWWNLYCIDYCIDNSTDTKDSINLVKTNEQNISKSTD